MSDDQRFDGPEQQRPFGMPTQRTPVQFDLTTGGLRIGALERRVEDPSEPSSVYGAYLSLLYAVRGAKPGEQLPLREADLEALLLIVGDDPATIEQRLVGLMGCSAEEASALSRVLLRHRRLTATLGIAASLVLGGVVAAGGDSSDPSPARTELVQSAGAASPGGGTLGPVVPSAATAVSPIAVAAPDPAPAPLRTSTRIGPVATAAPAPAAPAGTRTVAPERAPTPGGGTTPPALPAPPAPEPVVAQPQPPAPAPAGEGPQNGPDLGERPPVPISGVTPGAGDSFEPPAQTPVVEEQPADRNLPQVPGRPIGGTTGDDGDGSSFEQPAPQPVDSAPTTGADPGPGPDVDGVPSGAGADPAPGDESGQGNRAAPGSGRGT